MLLPPVRELAKPEDKLPQLHLTATAAKGHRSMAGLAPLCGRALVRDRKKVEAGRMGLVFGTVATIQASGLGSTSLQGEITAVPLPRNACDRLGGSNN